MAYYCRVFAMEEGLKVSGKSNELVSLLGSLMETLERTKPDAKLVSPEEDSAYCENFALRIFAKADALDRRDGSERTAAKTAKMLYVASVFFEILHQFPGAVDEDTLAKQRYAAWRAGELSACAREGRLGGAGTTSAACYICLASSARESNRRAGAMRLRLLSSKSVLFVSARGSLSEAVVERMKLHARQRRAGASPIGAGA